MAHLYLISIDNLDPIKRLAGLHKGGQFYKQLFQIFCDGLLPDKGVLIGERLDFRAVYEDSLSGKFPATVQEFCHLPHDLLRAGGKMKASKAREGGVVRHLFSFQKLHEVDIPSAGLLHPPGKINMIHVGID